MFRFTIGDVLWLILVVITVEISYCHTVARSAETPSDSGEALKILEETYARNRAKFAAFTCKFQVTEGTSKSLEEAIAGRIDGKLIRNGLWVVSPDEMRYELDCPPGTSTLKPPAIPPSEAKAGGVFTEIDCLPRIELWSRKAQMAVSVSPVLRVVNLKEQSDYPAILNPLSLGIMGAGELNSPAAFIVGYRAGSRSCRYKGETDHEGTKLAVIETRMRDTDLPQPFWTWYLDLARGAFPVRVVFREANGTLNGETRTLSVKEAPNGGFIAEQFLQTTWTRDDRLAVIRVTLTDLTLAAPPRDRLAVPITPGFQVIDVSDMRSAFRTTRRETMYADEMELWRKRCHETLQARLEKYKRLDRPK
jgi:hypothetical protein